MHYAKLTSDHLTFEATGLKPTRKPADTVGNAVSARPTESHARAAML